MEAPEAQLLDGMPLVRPRQRQHRNHWSGGIVILAALALLMLHAVHSTHAGERMWGHAIGSIKPVMTIVPIAEPDIVRSVYSTGASEKQPFHRGTPLLASEDLKMASEVMSEDMPALNMQQDTSLLAPVFQQLAKGLALVAPLGATLFGAKQVLASHNSADHALDSADSSSMRRWLMGLGILAGLCMFPAVGYAASSIAQPAAAVENFGAGFAQAFSLIFFSEVGDKTFFIAGLLAVKYGKLVSYLGSMAALSAMSVIAVLFGQVFHAVPPSLTNGLPLDDYAATILFAYFGIQAIREAAQLPANGESKMDEELEEAEDVVEDFGKKIVESKFWPLFVSTCSLVFAAEFGDKSFLATIGLSAAQNPFSVTVGAVAGHGLATAIAVIGGAIISKYLSERVMGYVSGGFFLTFAITTLLSLLGINVPLPF